MRPILPLALLALGAACTGKSADDSAVDSLDPDAPALAFVSPLTGDTVPTGALDLTFQVDNFPLVDPGEHTEFYDGYIKVSYTSFGTQLEETTSTTSDSINIGDAGEHTISAELYTAEGEVLDPAVSTSVVITTE